jgi:hypothetical protein
MSYSWFLPSYWDQKTYTVIQKTSVLALDLDPYIIKQKCLEKYLFLLFCDFFMTFYL